MLVLFLHFLHREDSVSWRGTRDASGGVAVALFAVYVMAHQMYLNGEYWSAYGMCKAALLMTNDVYPISMIYIRCMMAMCRINRKDMQESQSEFMKGWNLAKMDNFIEPFIEHHGLLRGLVEACIRKHRSGWIPEDYRWSPFFQQRLDGIHNNETKRK